jgi:hypothetical protein
MIKAITSELDRAEEQEAFVAQARVARERVVAGGPVVDGPAFADYLRRRVRGDTRPRPAAQPINGLADNAV